MKSTVKQVLRFYEVLWNEHDMSAIATILHEEVSFRGSLGLKKTGHAGFAAYTDLVHHALDNFQCIVDDIVGEGNTVFAKMIFRGNHQNQLLDYEATGRQVEWAGCARFQFDGHLISDVWVLGDLEGLKAQLKSHQK